MSSYELATAYVQIVPTTKDFKSKLKSAIGSDVETSGSDSGSSWGEKFASGAKAVVKVGAAACATVLAAAATGAVALGKEVVEQYSEYEQLVGGAELMWGDAYDYIAEKAANAFADVQMSTADYLESANYYATGLKTALDGDTQAAAELANDIITAQADIVAATGNSSEAVSNAFNGVMKGNYTMLDNLGLGIAGTKEGMQSVIDSVNEWRIAQGEAGDLTIDSIADCEQALVDYVEMQGMAGYAASEGAETISGSFSTLEASWDNFIVGLGDSEADITTLAQNLVTAFSNVVTNITPIITSLVEALPIAIQAISDALPTVIPAIMTALQSLITSVVENLDSILDSVLSIVDTLIDMIIENLPTILPKLVSFVLDLITGIAAAILENLGPILSAVGECLLKILDAIGTWFFELVGLVDEEGDGIWDNVAEWFLGILSDIGTWLVNILSSVAYWFLGLISDIGNWISNIWSAISTWFANLISNISTWLSNIWSSISGWFTGLISDVGTWAQGIWDSIANFFSKAWELGKNLVTGIWNGISGAASWLWGKITGWLSGIWDGIKSFFGVHSPSTQMAWIGEMLAEGLAKGIDDEADTAVNSALDMAESVADVFSDPFTTAVESGLSTLSGNVNATLSAESDGSTNAVGVLNEILKAIADGKNIYIDKDKWVGSTASDYNRAFGRLSVMEARA